MAHSEEDRKLIQIVEYHQVLWDSRIKGYRDKKLTQHAWQSVAELLERSVTDVIQRWTSLRKRYSRRITQLRQKTGLESPERSCHLLSLLSFLRPCIASRKIPPNPPPSNYTSTEDVSSSSMSEGSSEVAPLLIHLNPVDKASSEQNEIQEKITAKGPKSFSSSARALKKPFRSLATRSNKLKTIQPSVTKSTNTLPVSLTQYKEQSDDSLSGTPPKIPRLESNTLKSSSSVTKPECVKVKPVVNSSEEKIKNLNTIADNSASPVLKTSVDNSSSPVLKTSVDNSSSSVLKTSVDNSSSSVLKTSEDNSYSYVQKSTNDHSEFSMSRGYDADDYFLLSLAPDLRRLTSRQKYEVKSKMLHIVSEQYLKN